MLRWFAALWGRGVDLASRERLLVGASLFRIGAGLTILYQCLINYRQRNYLYGPDGVYPFDLFLRGLHESGSFSLYAISTSPLDARPQAREARVKIAMPTTKISRRP